MKIFLGLLIGLVGQQLAAQENLQRYLDLLKSGDLCNKRSAVLALYERGKGSIPALIEHIDDKEIVPSSTLILANPLLSSAPPGSQRDQAAGLLYSYVVELILGRNVLSSHDEEGKCVYLLDTKDYVYGHGLIFRENDLIKATDLPKIKEIYLQWWENNGKKSLAELRRDWKASRRPLSGTQYRWY